VKNQMRLGDGKLSVTVMILGMPNIHGVANLKNPA
jgi:hypothetical protein